MLADIVDGLMDGWRNGARGGWQWSAMGRGEIGWAVEKRVEWREKVVCLGNLNAGSRRGQKSWRLKQTAAIVGPATA